MFFSLDEYVYNQNLNLIFDVALKRIRYKKNFAIFNKTNQRKFCEQFCKNGSKSSDQSSC